MSGSFLHTARTSETHPLRIATVPVGNEGGAVGITFAPGKHQGNPMSGRPWARTLDADIKAIVQWGASDLVSLIEPHEFRELMIQSLSDQARAAGLHWYGLPIVDGCAPDDHFLEAWATLGPSLARGLIKGRRVVVHCKGGLGRAGTVACMLLIGSGTVQTAEAAISLVRSVRPGAIETLEQERFLQKL